MTHSAFCCYHSQKNHLFTYPIVYINLFFPFSSLLLSLHSDNLPANQQLEPAFIRNRYKIKQSHKLLTVEFAVVLANTIIFSKPSLYFRYEQ